MVSYWDEWKDWKKWIPFGFVMVIVLTIVLVSLFPSETSKPLETPCLDLIGKENWDKFGYKGGFLDEIVCEEDIENIIKVLENVSPERFQAIMDELEKKSFGN